MPMTSSGSAKASTCFRSAGSHRHARPQSAVMERGTGTMRPGRPFSPQTRYMAMTPAVV